MFEMTKYKSTLFMDGTQRLIMYYTTIVDPKENTPHRKRTSNHLPPINIITMLKIFSLIVVADTFPNPTDVRLVKVK